MKKIFSKKAVLLLAIIGIYTVGYISASAQEFNVYSESDIFVEANPEIPGPNEHVSLTLNSYSFNLNNYYITWFKNGEKISAGYGNRDLSFTTGANGIPTDITAVIEVGNQVYRKEFRFTPSTVDLIWEAADAYVPAFYKGKKLPITESVISVIAIPETQLIAPSDGPKLVYYWDNNYNRDVDASGFGKQSYSFKANPLNESERITVTSNDRRENSFSTNTITIPTKSNSVETLFYKINNNGRLMMNRALNNFNIITEPQVKMSFHPFNISTIQPNFTDIFVNWKINNNSQAPQDFSRQNELFIAPREQSGSSIIAVETEGIRNISQQHEESFRISFGQKIQ